MHLVLPEATLEAMDSSSWSLTHHTHYTHTPHMHTSCTHLHGHSHTTHSLRRSHTTHTNATKRILQTALWEAARTHLLTPTYVLTRALAHSRTHLLLHSFTPIHFCTLCEKIIFTCGVIRSFNLCLCSFVLMLFCFCSFAYALLCLCSFPSALWRLCSFGYALFMLC